MRNIKFRGKKIDGVKWIYGYYANEPSDGAVILSDTGTGYDGKKYLDEIVVDPSTVGQFTGLLDKNGEEIYEGDILPVYEEGQEYKYKVIYDGDCFMLSMLDGEQGSYPLSVKNRISEVIGDINSNLELLKEEV